MAGADAQNGLHPIDKQLLNHGRVDCDELRRVLSSGASGRTSAFVGRRRQHDDARHRDEAGPPQAAGQRTRVAPSLMPSRYVASLNG